MKRSFEQVVKKIMLACGFAIHRRGTRRTTLAEVLDHVSRLGFMPHTVIDVGVGSGTFELYEKFPNAKHLLIEPVREWEEILKKISRKYDAEYVLAAASDKQGTIIINIPRTRHPGLRYLKNQMVIGEMWFAEKFLRSHLMICARKGI